MFEDKDERVENVVEGAQNAAEQSVSETVQSTAQDVQSAAEEVKSAAQESAQEAQSAAQEVQSAAQEAQSAAQESVKAAQESVQEAQSAAQESVKAAQESAQEAQEADTTYRINFRREKEQQTQQAQQTQQTQQTQQAQQAQQQYQQAQQQQQYQQQAQQQYQQQTQQRYQQQTQQQQYQQTQQQQYQQTQQQRYQQQQQQRYQQQAQQQYQQQQYSYTAQGGNTSGAGGSGSGGTGNGGRRNNRADRRASTPRRRHPYLLAVGCAVICGAIIAVCVVGSFAIGRNMVPTNTVTVTTNQDNLASAIEEETTPVVEAETIVSSGNEYTVAQIAEQCGASVVAITNRSVSEVMTMFGYFEQESEGSGSGVIVGLSEDELLIVTNYHVVEDSDELTVCFFDSEEAVYSAMVKGTDPNDDLAVVAIPVSDIDADILGQISIATIGNSDDMRVGDEVVAIGNALGLGQSVTSGIISAVDREVTIDNYTARLIQTDAAINPGNSGGALFNMKGELIGINSAKYASEEIEGMGFAIPTSIAEPIIETLMSQTTRTKLEANYGCLNITGSDVTTDAYRSYGMPTGVYVNAVLEGGAAANAGIQTGDIITAMDGISLTGIEMLKDRLQYFKAGETVEFTVARNNGNGYEEFDVEVTLDNASEQDASAFGSSSEEEEDSYGYGDGNYYGYGDGDYYGYGDGDYYGYDDGDYYYGYGDIEDFFNEFGNGSYGYGYGN